MRLEPEHRIPRTAIKAWRISGGLQSLILWLILLVFWLFDAEEAIATGYIIAVIIFATAITWLLIFLIPKIRWKRWRYEVNEHEIDLRYGIFLIRRTLVPVNRIQHVDTRQGPVLRSFNLADVTISTAATTHEIPALTEETADTVRDQISGFVRKAKEDV